MTDTGSPTDLTSEQFVIDRDGLDELITVLISEGYRVIGPTVRDSAIVLDTLDSGDQLPTGWGVDTAPGLYRLRRRADCAVFGHSAGPQSWKQYLHPSRQQLWSQSTDDTFHAPPTEPVRYAFLGVRACDLAAIGILQTVLSAGGKAATNLFEGLFVIAANCTEPGGVCFCASMNTGPKAKTGYDLCLTERIDNDGHRFVTGVGTTEGSRILTLVRGRQATDEETTEAAGAVADAADHMGRQMPDVDLRGMLRDARDADVWTDVASRCLTCGNCTWCARRASALPPRTSPILRATMSSDGSTGRHVSTWTTHNCTVAQYVSVVRAGTDSGFLTSWAPGTTNSVRPGASVAADASTGVQWESTSRRKRHA